MRRSPLLLALAGLLSAVTSGCPTKTGCPLEGAIERARATDGTHVEITLRCALSGVTPDRVSVVTFARGPDASLPIAAVGGTDTLTVETGAAQIALATYTVRLTDVRGPDGALVSASANFVGAGQVDTAPVTLTVDDTYDQTLTDV